VVTSQDSDLRIILECIQAYRTDNSRLDIQFLCNTESSSSFLVKDLEPSTRSLRQGYVCPLNCFYRFIRVISIITAVMEHLLGGGNRNQSRWSNLSTSWCDPRAASFPSCSLNCARSRHSLYRCIGYCLFRACCVITCRTEGQLPDRLSLGEE
jgi:hypothetical protein